MVIKNPIEKRAIDDIQRIKDLRDRKKELENE